MMCNSEKDTYTGLPAVEILNTNRYLIYANILLNTTLPTQFLFQLFVIFFGRLLKPGSSHESSPICICLRVSRHEMSN